MSDEDLNLVISSLSGTQSRYGIVIEVNIFRLETDVQWSLEVVNPNGTSSVWDDQFDDDSAAFEAFEDIVTEEGMAAFLDGGNVIPLPQR